MALQEHFYHSSNKAKVTIDLKRRMRIEQVRINPAASVIIGPGVLRETQRIMYQTVRMIAVAKPRPCCDFPGKAPTCALISPKFQGTSRCGKQIGCLRSDLVAGIESVQV